MMKRLGGGLVICGAVLIVLSFFAGRLALLAWIDSWGTAAGWSIRIGLVVFGGILLLTARSAKSPRSEGLLA